MRSTRETRSSTRIRSVSRQGPKEYVEWAFADQKEAECRFGEPIVSGDRAAVDWWGVIVAPDDTVEALAGTSLLRFDARRARDRAA